MCTFHLFTNAVCTCLCRLTYSNGLQSLFVHVCFIHPGTCDTAKTRLRLSQMWNHLNNSITSWKNAPVQQQITFFASVQAVLWVKLSPILSLRINDDHEPFPDCPGPFLRVDGKDPSATQHSKISLLSSQEITGLDDLVVGDRSRSVHR